MFAFILLSLLSLFVAKPAYALYEPLSVANNKFGIHVADPNDIPATAALVNSTGGDWGYVTLVIPETDRSVEKWQKVFNEMRRLHLIPLVRLATHVEGDAWAKPTPESFPEWVDFLSKLNWPIENRYVIIFNEPNHAKEWGNSLDPEGYAEILVRLAGMLKEKSEDFFILPAGLDASAASDGLALDEAVFLQRMSAAKPEIFRFIDGWTSHSYPNPGFSGAVTAWGRGTLRTYQWELAYLQELGNQKNLPVFITETGWVHSQGKLYNPKLLSPEAVGGNLKLAAASAWQDQRIAAITPFVFNYQDFPFDHFSWKTLGASDVYAHYYDYQSLPKIKGRPKQHQLFKLREALFPTTLVAGSTYTLQAMLQNLGQGILDAKDDFALTVDAGDRGFQTLVESLPTLEPGETGTLTLHLQTPLAAGSYKLSAQLVHFTEKLELETQNVAVVPPPSLIAQAQLAWRRTGEASDVTLLVYDRDKLLHKFTGLSLAGGRLEVKGLNNIIPGATYRLVLLVPYYLPRQRILPLGSQKTAVTFRRLLPLDFNHDGAFSLADLVALLRFKPNQIFALFFGP